MWRNKKDAFVCFKYWCVCMYDVCIGDPIVDQRNAIGIAARAAKYTCKTTAVADRQ